MRSTVFRATTWFLVHQQSFQTKNVVIIQIMFSLVLCLLNT